MSLTPSPSPRGKVGGALQTLTLDGGGRPRSTVSVEDSGRRLKQEKKEGKNGREGITTHSVMVRVNLSVTLFYVNRTDSGKVREGPTLDRKELLCNSQNSPF